MSVRRNAKLFVPCCREFFFSGAGAADGRVLFERTCVGVRAVFSRRANLFVLLVERAVRSPEVESVLCV